VGAHVVGSAAHRGEPRASAGGEEAPNEQRGKHEEGDVETRRVVPGPPSIPMLALRTVGTAPMTPKRISTTDRQQAGPSTRSSIKIMSFTCHSVLGDRASHVVTREGTKPNDYGDMLTSSDMSQHQLRPINRAGSVREDRRVIHGCHFAGRVLELRRHDARGVLTRARSPTMRMNRVLNDATICAPSGAD
jgi:hypothetical protein